MLRVPLIFVGTKYCRPGTRVTTTVSLADLTPTVLDILNLRQSIHVSGRSLKEGVVWREHSFPSVLCGSGNPLRL